jgi:predicted RNA-binding Zn-ribbon protein involved in translation (DUF1610 family)
MKPENDNRPVPQCPSCGLPIKRDFRLSNSVKMVLALLLVGYAVLSVMIFLAGTPPEMRKGCGSFDYRIQLPFFTPNPERCRETDSDLWLKSLLSEPSFQILIGGGLAAGFLIFYVDWFQELYRKWRTKRSETFSEDIHRHKYKCRKCGYQWN